MVDQENLQEACDKARTLKAQDNLAAIDPDRTLLSDMLTTLHRVSPYGEFNAERHQAQRKIHDFLTGAHDPAFYRAQGRVVIQRGFLLDKLTEVAAGFEKGSPLFETQQDVAVEMQHRIKHADPAFRQWLGNPFGDAEIPTPRWLEQVQAERALAP